MRSLEQLDSWISAKLKAGSSKASGVSQKPELLEIRRDLLESIRDQIEPKGEGKSAFPYNTVSIHIAAATSGEQERLATVFGEEDGLDRDVRELLVEAGCAVPGNFTVEVTIDEDAELARALQPFQIAYAAAQHTKIRRDPIPSRPAAKLTVLRGKTETPECRITSDRFSIGRLREVVGSNDGLRRRNDLAFSEEETTVSREHAQIRYQLDAGKFRLYDSVSQRGTCVFREGRRLEVSKGASRGLQLQSGDEIHLGEARVLFQIE